MIIHFVQVNGLLPANLDVRDDSLFHQFSPVPRPGSPISASLAILCGANCLIEDFKVKPKQSPF